MKMKERVGKSAGNQGLNFLSVLRGSVIALASSLLLILVLAFLLKFTSIPDNVISPINQVIKGVSVFLGVFIGLKKSKEMGLLSGLLIGIIYTLIAFFVFSLLAGSFIFDATIAGSPPIIAKLLCPLAISASMATLIAFVSSTSI